MVIRAFLTLLVPRPEPGDPVASDSDEEDWDEDVTSGASDFPPLFWPSIEEIRFSCRDMGHNDRSNVWSKLRRTLRARLEMGQPVGKVVLEDCPLPEEWHDEWEADPRLPELEWDFERGQYAEDLEEESD